MLELTADVFTQIVVLLDISDAVALLSSSQQLNQREGLWPMLIVRDFRVQPQIAGTLNKNYYVNRYLGTCLFDGSFFLF
jgi:hypothetical protein